MRMRVMAVMVAVLFSVAGLAHGQLKDNGDGTITDNAQGIVWLKNANCYGEISWNDGFNRVPSLQSGQCGLTDKSTGGQWRLPTKTELLARVGNYAGFTNVQPRGYWTSQTSDYSAYAAWAVSMGSGNAYGNNKANRVDMYMWPVRAK